MAVKKKLKETKVLIAAFFLISIIGIITTVTACGSNRILLMATGDDLDINATDVIIGSIKFGKGDELPSAKAVFHQRIYDESSDEKLYTMMGIMKHGDLISTSYYFLCPVFGVWFINVWQVIGEGIYKTTDTNLDLTYRNWFYITLPNTEGKFVPISMVMLLSPTAEYCLFDPGIIPPGSSDNPIITDPDIHPWVLIGVLCGIIVQTPFGEVELPIGPASYLTRSIEI